MKITVKKDKKLLLSIFLAVVFMFTLIAGNVITADFSGSLKVVNADFVVPDSPANTWHFNDDEFAFADYELQGSGTSENPYLIVTAKDLAFVSYKTRASSNYTNYEGKYFRQTANIDLAGRLWMPIGTTNANRRFCGNYDGAGFEIKNMCVFENNQYLRNGNYFGLFSSVYGGEFKNINITDGYINARNRGYAGMFAAQAINIKAENINVTGGLIASKDGSNYDGETIGRNRYVGGLFATIDNQSFDFARNKVINCTNSATVRGLSYVGGIAGWARNVYFINEFESERIINNTGAIYGDYKSSSNSYVGGVVGFIDGSSTILLDKLTNKGVIDLQSGSNAGGNVAGGIVGNSTSLNVDLQINNCINEGEIKLNQTSGGSNAGGIIGTAVKVKLVDSQNLVPVTGRGRLGGLVGESRKVEIINSENNENAKLTATSNNVGGLVGYVSDQTIITNCKNAAEIVASLSTGGNGSGGLVGFWGGKNSEITECENSGQVTSASAGGAIGYISGANITIDNFVNKGKMISSQTAGGSSQRGTGGIIGTAGSTGSVIVIKNSENRANLVGSYVGGAIGHIQLVSELEIDNFVNYSTFDFSQASSGNEPNALGGIVGLNNARTIIKNSHNEGNMLSTGSYVGGLVGRMLNATTTVENSYNLGNITGRHYIGGICGVARGEYKNVYNKGNVNADGEYVGGIIGLFYSGKLENCYTAPKNAGGTIEVESTGYTTGSYFTSGQYVGGLVGATNSGSSIEIVDCVNAATVSGRLIAGGIIGRSVQKTNLKNVVNNGEVTADLYYAGGLIGQQSSGNTVIELSYNNADVSSNLENYTNGNTGYATGGLMGAVSSSNALCKILNSENKGNVSGQYVGGILGHTSVTAVANLSLKNLINSGSVTSYIAGSGGYAGGIIGTGGNGNGAALLENCSNAKLDAGGNEVVITGRYAGGLIGILHTAEIRNCNNIAKVVSTYTDSTNVRGIGGLVYRSYYFVRIYDSYNRGDLVITGRMQTAAGLVGYARNVVIDNCYNLSDISNSYSHLNWDDIYMGGLVGYAENCTTFIIANSYNAGDLTFSGRYIGGLVGRVYNTIGRTASDNGTTIIQNSYVTASVTNNNASFDSFTGGLIGQSQQGISLLNIMVEGNVTGSYYVGGLIGRLYFDYNVVDGLTYNIENCYYIGEISGTQRNGNSSAGSLIGVVNFANSSDYVQQIELTVKNSYSRALLSTNIIRKAGFIGYIYYVNTNNYTQSIKVTDSFYTVDTGYDYVAEYGSRNYGLTEKRLLEFDNSYGVNSVTLKNSEILSFDAVAKYLVTSTDADGNVVLIDGHETMLLDYNPTLEQMQVYNSSIAHVSSQQVYEVTMYSVEHEYKAEQFIIQINGASTVIVSGEVTLPVLNELFSKTNYTDWHLKGEGLPSNVKTYWTLSEYNDGLPYLSNMFNAQIIFDANGENATIGGSAEPKIINDKVGNKLIIIERLVAKPVREFYEFKGWNTDKSQADAGIVEYVYNESIFEIENIIQTLYAVWAPERILIEIVGNGNITNAGGDTITDPYITIDTTNRIKPYVNTEQGQTFENWEIFDPQQNKYVYFDAADYYSESYTPSYDPESGIIHLNAIITEDFIARFAYFNDNGRRTISLQQITSGSIQNYSISLANSALYGVGNVQVNDAVYKFGQLMTVTDDTELKFTLKINTAAYYEFAGFIFKNAEGEVIENYEAANVAQNSETGIYTITVTQRLVVELKFDKTPYTVSIKQVLNNAERTLIDSVDLVAGDESEIQVVINTSLDGLTASTTNEYRFVGFQIYNKILLRFETFVNNTNISKNFLDNFLGNAAVDEIEIQAVFVRRYKLEVSVLSGENLGQGDFIAYIRNADGTNRPLTFGTDDVYIDENSNVIIEANASSNSTLDEFTGVDAANIAGSKVNFRIGEDTTIEIKFKLSYYKFKSVAIDHLNNEIKDGTESVDAVSIQTNVDGNNLDKIIIGTKVHQIARKIDEISGYSFFGWYFNVDGRLIAVEDVEGLAISSDGSIATFDITQEFIDEYANENFEIVIAAKFYKLYAVSIDSSDDLMGSFDLFIDVSGSFAKVENSVSEFVWGTRLLIKPKVLNETYYRFAGFNGLEAQEVADSSNWVQITLVANRFITINYAAIEMTLATNVDTKNAKGTVTFSQETMAVNDVVIITFAVDSGYEIMSWTIKDKNGVSHSVNDLERNIQFSNSTLVLTVDEFWLDNFGTTFESEIKTMMNKTFFTVLLVGAIVIPLLLAGIIIFIILNNKKKAQALAIAKREKQTAFALNQDEFISNLRNGTVNKKDSDKDEK